MQSIGGGRRYQSFKRRRISLLFVIRIGRRIVGELRQSSGGRSPRCIRGRLKNRERSIGRFGVR
jgi:hypothetical protein